MRSNSPLPDAGRREFLATFAAGCASVAAGSLVGCADQSRGNSGGSKRLRIGYQKSSTSLNLLRVDKVLEKKLAPRVAVEWTEFSAGPQLLEGINVGSIDFGHAGEAPPVFAQAAGVPLLYVAAEPQGPNAEAILVRRNSPVQKVADLKGKRVALNRGSNVHYLLVRALEAVGLEYDDVEVVFLPPADARAAFESGSVEAWVIWDPYYALAERTGQTRMLVDGTGLVENRGYFLADRDFVAEQPETLATLIDELRVVAEWASKHRPEVARFLSKLTGVEEAAILASEHRRQYGVELVRPEMIVYQQNVADTFFRLGLIPKQIRVADAFHTAT